MLQQNLQVLASALGLDIHYLRENGGDLSQLSDGDKTSLVAALNSLKEYANSYLDGVIHDASQSSDHAYSSNKIEATIQSAIDLIKVGAPEAYDTLKEIADYIAQDQTQMSGILTSMEKLVRYDQTMSLTEPEKANLHNTLALAISQIGIESIYAGFQPKQFKDVEFYVPHSLGGRIFQIIGDDVSQVAIANTSTRAPYPPNQFISTEFSSDGEFFLSHEGYLSGYPKVRVVAHKRNANGTFAETGYYDNVLAQSMLASKQYPKVVYKQTANQTQNWAQILGVNAIDRSDPVQPVAAAIHGKMAETRDGSKLAVAMANGSLHILSVTDGNPMSFAQAGSVPASQFTNAICNNSMAFSPDGKILAGASRYNATKQLAIVATSGGDFTQRVLHAFDTEQALQPRLFWVDSNTIVVQQNTNLQFYRILFDGVNVSVSLVKTLPVPVGMIIDGVTDDGRHIFMRTLAGGMRILRHVSDYQYDVLANITTGPTTLELSHTNSRLLD